MRTGRGSWRFASAALAAVVVLALGGCGPSGPSAGRSLNPNHATISGLAPVRPGDEIGMLFLDLQNRSDSALTLDSVGFPGRGAGTVVRIIEVKIAPDVSGDLSVPGGAYQTDPPVSWWPPTRSCGP
jgi:hypothetical protein